MCGICGFYNEGSAVLVAKMCRLLAHRGPDDTGTFIRSRVGLGMTRLAIIAPENGHQPILNEDGNRAIVFNGEIYNYRELKRELEAKGHRFRTASDTEVILHLYEEEGPGAVLRLRGVFAFAIWDGTALFMARDRLGVKPLYYANVGDSWYFASEVKALLICPGIRREVDPEALDDFLTLQYVPGPKTLFKGIFKLPPGHRISIGPRGATISAYWVLPEPTRGEESLTGRRGRTRALLEDAVASRTMSDVPIGALLSGGLDSSLVVALLARYHRGPVDAFHIRFQGEEGEWRHARRVAAATGCAYHEYEVGPDALDEIPLVIWHLDEPIADAAAWATYIICRFARPRVKVLLTGEGGDEVFGGYPRYYLSRLAGWYHAMPAFAREGLRAAAVSRAAARPDDALARYAFKVTTSAAAPLQRNLAWLSVFDKAARADLYTADMRRETGPGRAVQLFADYYAMTSGSSLRRLTALDIRTWLADDILTKVDKTSMAAGVEARVPLLDQNLVDYVARLDGRDRFGLLTPKKLLKAAATGLLPREIIERRKRAFIVPLDIWLRRYRRAWVYDTLVSTAARNRGYFRNRAILGLLDRYMADGSSGRLIWTLFCLELWHQAFIDNPSREPQDSSLAVCVT
jgi:asparagine synthase (glutamine-hydrolysing)